MLQNFQSDTKPHKWFDSYRTIDNKEVDFLSTIPLHIETRFRGEINNKLTEYPIATGTAFIIESVKYGNGIIRKERLYYLITNWHMVKGLNAENGETYLGKNNPNILRVSHHKKNCLGEWVAKDISLYSQDESLMLNQDKIWHEHPQNHKVDVVAIPITKDDDIDFYPLNLSDSDNLLLVTPSESVSIIGFPEGKSVDEGKFPLWKTGHIASDIQLNKFKFHIDATTKHGMSGSPVFAKRVGSYFPDRHTVVNGSTIRFLGIYSGRISESIDIGNVWHPEVLKDIIPNFSLKTTEETARAMNLAYQKEMNATN